MSHKRELLDYLFQQNILVSKDLIENIPDDLTEPQLQRLLDKIKGQDILFLNQDLLTILHQQEKVDANWVELERSQVEREKGKPSKVYDKFVDYFKANKKEEPKTKSPLSKVKIVTSYGELAKKREFQDFVAYFNKRYEVLKEILIHRPELQGLISINRIINKRDRDTLSLIGIIKDKRETKSGNIMLTVEDQTGQINVFFNRNKPDLYEQAKELVLDEIVGIKGVNGDNIIFANSLIFPDVPITELKKSNTEEYAIFLSDLHVGSSNFLADKFNKFLEWIQGKAGSESQRDLVNKIKYIFITGDLVAGVGVYPGQEDELFIKDIYQQYQECANLLKQIPIHIPIIICPGNHDAVSLAEPQPTLDKDFAKPLWDMQNITMVSNPAVVNIGAQDNFEGFNVLMYHGYSFPFYVDAVESLRQQGGLKRPDLLMKFLLKRRHLAPTHTSTLYIPVMHKDPLVIEKKPDFFVSGHLHKTSVANYNNVTLICGSCWESQTSFEKKLGLSPEPARIPLVNLQTRDVKILRF